MNDEFESMLVGQARRDGISRHGVGAMIRRDLAVLLLARPSDDFMGCMYELPSGQGEDGAHLEGALRREVAEETGLTSVKRVLARLSRSM